MRICRRNSRPLITVIRLQDLGKNRKMMFQNTNSLSAESDPGPGILANNNEYPYYQLEVHLNAGRDLMAMDAGGTSDPYVKFRIGGKQIYRSRTISKTLNPVWNEHFMTLIDDIHQPLVLRAYDHDFALSDDFLGTAAIDLTSLKFNE